MTCFNLFPFAFKLEYYFCYKNNVTIVSHKFNLSNA